MLLANKLTTNADLRFETIIRPLFDDHIRVVGLDKIIIPRTAARFKLADILAIEKLITMNKIDTTLTVNSKLMLTDGCKRYYAMRRLGMTKVQVRLDTDLKAEGDECPFSIIR